MLRFYQICLCHDGWVKNILGFVILKEMVKAWLSTNHCRYNYSFLYCFFYHTDSLHDDQSYITESTQWTPSTLTVTTVVFRAIANQSFMSHHCFWTILQPTNIHLQWFSIWRCFQDLTAALGLCFMVFATKHKNNNFSLKLKYLTLLFLSPDVKNITSKSCIVQMEAHESLALYLVWTHYNAVGGKMLTPTLKNRFGSNFTLLLL